ncbi:MAG: response regulator [Nitrospiraceae bacterium]|nr:response regulator [Nitrospiraceae bacterium]
MKRILIVDDDSSIRILLETLLKKSGYEVHSAADGTAAISKAINFLPDAVLLDVEMPRTDGLSTLKEIRSYASMKHLPVIMLTSHSDEETVLRAIRGGANDYILKPFDYGILLAKLNGWLTITLEEEWKALPLLQSEALHRIKVKMAEAMDAGREGRELPYQDLKYASDAMAGSLEKSGFSDILLSTEAYHSTLFLHSLLVSIFAYLFAIFRGTEKEEALLMALGGLLHDIGSVRIPNEILFKPEELSPDEHEKVKMHVSHGLEMLGRTNNVDKTVLEICGCHHEHIDGTGYPRGLKGEQIPFHGRLIAIVEAYTSLTTKTVYRAAYDRREALKKLRDSEGHFDGDLLAEFENAVLQGFRKKKA